MVRACLLLGALLVCGCRRDAPAPLAPPTTADGGAAASAATAPSVIEATFEELYPLFLLRKISPSAKAELWSQQYHRKWIHWTGTLVGVTHNSALFRHIPGTITFDVSVTLEAGERARLSRMKPGTRVGYLGQLEKFEAVFRTFYLVHGRAVTP